MSTRSGDVDHAAIIFLQRKLHLDADDIENLMNKESGLLGISGYTKDMKTLVDDYSKNERSKLAVDMYVDRVVDYIAQFYVSLNGADALVFTAGIGCGSSRVREMICEKLEVLGVKLDLKKNKVENVAENLKVSDKKSKVEVFVIPTNEEVQMLREIKRF
jgi:acetate kinase